MCFRNKVKENDYKYVATETVKEIYEDGIKETVKQTGKTLSLIPRFINAALSGFEQWILNREYTVKRTEKLLEYKLQILILKIWKILNHTLLSQQLMQFHIPFQAMNSLNYILISLPHL